MRKSTAISDHCDAALMQAHRLGSDGARFGGVVGVRAEARRFARRGLGRQLHTVRTAREDCVGDADDLRRGAVVPDEFDPLGVGILAA